MVDFVDLATSSRWLIQRALGEVVTYEHEDDFANLEVSTSYNNINNNNMNMVDGNGGVGGGVAGNVGSIEMGGDSYTMVTTRPFLSKSAEAELYLLATNFLLYVALVIITTMVAKIYFPELLERGQQQQQQSLSSSRRKNYSYRRRRTQPGGAILSPVVDDNDSFFGDKDDDDDDDDDIDCNDEEEALFSDDDDDDDDEDDNGENMYPYGDNNNNHNMHDSMDSDFNTDSLLNEATAEGQPTLATTTGNGRNSMRNMIMSLDDEYHTSRTKVLQRLLFCCLMLNITFVTWGALQERMLTRRYPRHTGDYFTYSYALVFTNRFWTLVMSGIMWWYLKPTASKSTILYEYSFPAISNMLSSWCQYEALRYVSFPALTLFKSFKLAPVMLMGKILGNKSYPAYDYFVAFLIGTGIAMFMTSTDDLQWGHDYLGNIEAASAKWTGVMLLGLFLFFDSFTSQFQSRMFQRHVDLSMVEMMFATSAYSTVLSAITLVHTHELSDAIKFVYEHSEIHLHFFLFSICSTIGQLFIYYTIKNFGAVVFTLIMTTRILLSIGLSCILYGHTVSGMGFLGLIVVLVAVLYRIKRKAQGQQLIKWQGMEDDKGPELVQEWHEHVDM